MGKKWLTPDKQKVLLRWELFSLSAGRLRFVSVDEIFDVLFGGFGKWFFEFCAQVFEHVSEFDES